MNYKLIFVNSLLMLIVLSMVTFGYMTYAIYKDGANQNGAAVVKGHQLLFYGQMVVHLLMFGTGAIVWFNSEKK